MPDRDPPLTQLLALASHGDRDALDRVFAALYPELRRIAHARLWGERDDSMLGTTMLVHETFLHLVDAAQLTVTDRKHFYTYAAKTMRNIIIDLARERVAERRGSGERPLPIDTELAEQLGAADGADTLVRINDALLALEALDAELARVVEMRYFAGYTEAEVAELLASSERTVRRQWEKARAFLLVSLASDGRGLRAVRRPTERRHRHGAPAARRGRLSTRGGRAGQSARQRPLAAEGRSSQRAWPVLPRCSVRTGRGAVGCLAMEERTMKTSIYATLIALAVVGSAPLSSEPNTPGRPSGGGREAAVPTAGLRLRIQVLSAPGLAVPGAGVGSDGGEAGRDPTREAEAIGAGVGSHGLAAARR